MREIKRIPAGDMDSFAEIAADAYPLLHIRNEADKLALLKRLHEAEDEGFCSGIYGLYEDGRLLGGMRIYDFQMNFYEVPVLVGGVGFVGVSLLHKKEKVARDMIRWFMTHFREKGAPMVSLYAFRLDFYYQMGFGYGQKTRHYSIRPEALPATGPKDKLRYAKLDDLPQVLTCYERFAARKHGMMNKTLYELEYQLESTGSRLLIYESEGRVEAYAPFHFSGEQHAQYELIVYDLVYEHREALLQILSFLRSQADQASRIQLNTQDEDFYFLPDDTTNGQINQVRLHHQANVEELGIMYRLVNTRAFFEQLQGHSFGGQDISLRIRAADSFFPENTETLLVQFREGYPVVLDNNEKHDVEINLSVAELSSLAMGVVKFSSLYHFGKAEISDMRYLSVLDELFGSGTKPVNMTRF